jgi:hypothetical protein
MLPIHIHLLVIVVEITNMFPIATITLGYLGTNPYMYPIKDTMGS